MFKRNMAKLNEELIDLNNQERQPDEYALDDIENRKNKLLHELQMKMNKSIKKRNKKAKMKELIKNKNKKTKTKTKRNRTKKQLKSLSIETQRKLMNLMLDNDIKNAQQEYEINKSNLETSFQNNLDHLLHVRDTSIDSYNKKRENDDNVLYENAMATILDLQSKRRRTRSSDETV